MHDVRPVGERSASADCTLEGQSVERSAPGGATSWREGAALGAEIDPFASASFGRQDGSGLVAKRNIEHESLVVKKAGKNFFQALSA